MVGVDVEDRCHLPLLGAMPNQCGVPACAQRQCEGIEQNRLARPGFPGQHREPGGKVDIQPLNQDDVANR